MSRYHVNPETQRPNLCRASTPQGCKYYVGGEPEPPHFDTKEEARNYIEESSREENTGKKMGGLSKSSPTLNKGFAQAITTYPNYYKNESYGYAHFSLRRLEELSEKHGLKLDKVLADAGIEKNMVKCAV